MKEIEDLYKGFKTEQQIRDFLKDKTIHCVSCRNNFNFSQPYEIDYSLHNALAIGIEKPDGIVEVSVPSIICSCGYRMTLIKLLYQV